MQDSDYFDFILKLKKLGYEIALHNVSSGNSKREEIVLGLSEYISKIGSKPEINTFHAQNIENLYSGKNKLDSSILRFAERFLARIRQPEVALSSR